MIPTEHSLECALGMCRLQRPAPSCQVPEHSGLPAGVACCPLLIAGISADSMVAAELPVHHGSISVAGWSSVMDVKRAFLQLLSGPLRGAGLRELPVRSPAGLATSWAGPPMSFVLRHARRRVSPPLAGSATGIFPAGLHGFASSRYGKGGRFQSLHGACLVARLPAVGSTPRGSCRCERARPDQRSVRVLRLR